MPNTLSYNPDQTNRSPDQLTSRLTFVENKQEFHVDVDPEAANEHPRPIDHQRDIKARTALAKEVAVSYQPEQQAVPEQKQYQDSIGHAAVRTEWFRQTHLNQNNLERRAIL